MLSTSSIYFIIELKAKVGSIRLGQLHGPQELALEINSTLLDSCFKAEVPSLPPTSPFNVASSVWKAFKILRACL